MQLKEKITIDEIETK